jgi:mannitol 2-dehydrogenase
MMAAAARQKDDPLAFIRNEDLFGAAADDPRFTSTYTALLADLHGKGARQTLKDLEGRLGG